MPLESFANATNYLVLMAPAVSFLLMLAHRQGRISTIARENCKLIYELTITEHPLSKRDESRVRCLLHQNSLLLHRFKIIELMLIVICCGLCMFGCIFVCFQFYSTTSVLAFLFVALTCIGMIMGTAFVGWEMVRAADTISAEVEFAKRVAANQFTENSEHHLVSYILVRELWILIMFMAPWKIARIKDAGRTSWSSQPSVDSPPDRVSEDAPDREGNTQRESECKEYTEWQPFEEKENRSDRTEEEKSSN